VEATPLQLLLRPLNWLPSKNHRRRCSRSKARWSPNYSLHSPRCRLRCWLSPIRGLVLTVTGLRGLVRLDAIVLWQNGPKREPLSFCPDNKQSFVVCLQYCVTYLEHSVSPIHFISRHWRCLVIVTSFSSLWNNVLYCKSRGTSCKFMFHRVVYAESNK